ncbi:MAG TPA: hypothetical protein VET69_15930 [Terriglobales bacterium]|nr:hypothetical protein [Terriglobales bacterium]
MPGNALDLFLRVASLLASGLVAGKLFHTGLNRRYRAFFWYFLFRVAEIIGSLILDVKSNIYSYFWAFSEALSLILYVWVVLELCGLVLERHRGLYSLGRWAIGFGMVISLTLSFLSLLPKITPAMPQRTRTLGYFYAADRGVTFCLALFLLLMLFLLSRYPVPLSRNVILHSTLYTIFFLSNTLSVILSSVFGLRLYTAVDTGLMGVSTACALAWAFLLTPKGEDVRMTIPHFGPEHEERLLYQLDSLNTTLLRAARK